MSRAPFQILALPFRRSLSGVIEYAALRRADSGSWQGIAGGGKEGESAPAAARRESTEETGIPATAPFYKLDTVASIPAYHFAARKYWPSDLFVVPEYCFAVDCTGHELVLSDEHTEIVWSDLEGTSERLTYDSNRTALWELGQRILLQKLAALAHDA